MFWRMSGLSSTSPVELVLDKDTFTLEDLLDEDDIIQECKSLNSRLINFLQGKSQVQQLLRYVVEEPPEGADNCRSFKFPFIACEILTCDIDVLFKTVVEEEELMQLLFSFLDNERPHGTMLAGYFSKVVICLMIRKTVAVMDYLKAHQDILKKLVDLIGITSIMEVLVRLVGGDDHIYTFHAESLEWLADTELLELLVEKLSSSNTSEVHANAAETLSAVTRLTSSPLSLKLSSPSFIRRLFHHVLEEPHSKSTLIHSLSVCISLLDPRRSPAMFATRGQPFSEPLLVSPETVSGILQRVGDLLSLLDISSNENMLLPTTYGELKPPLGIHRLKIVEFVSVLLRSISDEVKQELVNHGAIKTVLNLFFQYPYNNALHHHVGNIIGYCIESNNEVLIDHILHDCNLVGKLLAVEEDPLLSATQSVHTTPAFNKTPPRIGNIGHLTRIANKIAQARNDNSQIQDYLQSHPKWNDWQSSVLKNRNVVEDVHHWACGRPTTLHDHPADANGDEFNELDYDVSTMASDLTREVFQYGIFDSEDADAGHGVNERDEEDAFFNDESAESVFSSLRLGGDYESGEVKDNIFLKPNWFDFEDDRSKQSTQTCAQDEEGNGELSAYISSPNRNNEEEETGADHNKSMSDLSAEMGKVGISDSSTFFPSDEQSNTDLYSSKPPGWVGWQNSLEMEGTSGRRITSSNANNTNNNPFEVDMEEAIEVYLDSRSEPDQTSNGVVVMADSIECGKDGSTLQDKVTSEVKLMEEGLVNEAGSGEHSKVSLNGVDQSAVKDV